MAVITDESGRNDHKKKRSRNDHPLPKSKQRSSEPTESSMRCCLGFEWSDFTSLESFSQLCSQPADPTCLALFRIAFGLLMVLDGLHERGLSDAVERWSDEFEVCRFPLFDFLKPLPVQWIILLYLIMISGAAGIALGAFFRLSCMMFAVPYWYLFLMDKSKWNNHSYLFGLSSLLFLFSDANRCWSVDAWRCKKKNYTHIPIWQYGIFRFQVMLVYFIGGLKKLDADWMEGYSMTSLSREWVFDPFRFILSDEDIDYYIVHVGGMLIDLTSGFLLYFNETRWFGTFAVTSFHAMNSRLFSIGQFPYVMLCTTAIFYPFDWPKRTRLVKYLPDTIQASEHCLYKDKKSKPYHKIAAVGVVLYMVWQSFMPYSHFITQGYNNWCGGLYGYSWDMMIHNWNTQHIKIKYVDRKTGEEGFLQPDAFVRDTRWASHPDMVKQHAHCIADFLADYQLGDVEIYMDVWQSLNKRFQQRMYDPHVNLLTAPWSPFHRTSWMLPRLDDLDTWRGRLNNLAAEAKQRDFNELIAHGDVSFVADFPGMMLENYIDPDLGRTNVTLLAGEAILYNPATKRNMTLNLNQPVRLPQGTHMMYAVSNEPSCYMYTYTNTTQVHLEDELDLIEHKLRTNQLQHGELIEQSKTNGTLARMLDMKKERDENARKAKLQQERGMIEQIKDRLNETYQMLRSAYRTSATAIESLVTGQSMLDLVERKYGPESSYKH